MSYPKTYQELRSEIRKTNKPLMEKRRRARINVCLSQLKSLVLDAMRKDTSRYSKLEKADVLEMTVRHLKTLHKQIPPAVAPDPSVTTKYRAGYLECANQVFQYLRQSETVNPQLSARIVHHLTTRVPAPSGQITNYAVDTAENYCDAQNNCDTNQKLSEKSPVNNKTIPSQIFNHLKNTVTMTTPAYHDSVTMATMISSDEASDKEIDITSITQCHSTTEVDMEPLDLSLDVRNHCRSRYSREVVNTRDLWRPWSN